MSYTYIYEPVALKELKDSIKWYQERSEMAAKNFATEVNDKIRIICGDPLRFRNIYSHFRETSLKKYPFYIVYFLDEKERKVIISSVYHHKRNPKKKYRK
ncbi:MAG TPA: type II toxin-antitoxin system RelE/ParE family toxin [Hanamia sp.]|nr:type II toxin-antitoxin system RelE/ParE family toxin [Hanamia sp.]